MTASPASGSSRRHRQPALQELVPGTSRQTALLVYDLLHFLCLHGGRQPRAVVVAYLARAGMCRPTTGMESQLRAFERLKTHLARLGVRYGYAFQHNGQESVSLFFVEAPERAKRMIESLLERTVPRYERSPLRVSA